MATGDKVVTLDGLKAVFDYQEAEVSDLKSNLPNGPQIVADYTTVAGKRLGYSGNQPTYIDYDAGTVVGFNVYPGDSILFKGTLFGLNGTFRSFWLDKNGAIVQIIEDWSDIQSTTGKTVTVPANAYKFLGTTNTATLATSTIKRTGIQQACSEYDLDLVKTDISTLSLNATSDWVSFEQGVEVSANNMITGLSITPGAKIWIKVEYDAGYNPLGSDKAIQIRANGKFITALTQARMNLWTEITLSSDYIDSSEIITSLGLFANSQALITSSNLRLAVKSKLYLDLIDSDFYKKTEYSVVENTYNLVPIISGIDLQHGDTILFEASSSTANTTIQILANNTFLTSYTVNSGITEIALHNDTYFNSGNVNAISVCVTAAYALSGDSLTIACAHGIGTAQLITNELGESCDELIDDSFVVPDFYKNHISQKVQEISAFERAAGNEYDSFVFVTDTNVAANRLYSANLIKYIIDNTSVDKVIFGGDAVSAYGTQSQILDEAYIMRNTYQKALRGNNEKLYFVRGNHDLIGKDNTDESNPSGFYYEDEVTASIYARNKNVSFGDYENNKLYYYFDDPIKKMRYICLDSNELFDTSVTDTWPDAYGFTQDQSDFLISALTGVSTKSGWGVVVAIHVPILGANTDTYYEVPRGILKAFADKTTYSYNGTKRYNSVDFTVNVNCDFTQNLADLICVVSGHLHTNGIETDGNFTQVITACDTRDSGTTGIARTLNTVNESCFDVFCINKKTKAVNIVRVGAGTNRSITY